MLDPEALRNFLHVIDLGSLSSASHLAHVTQPALSRQIRILEEEVGQQLFERTGRGMRATLFGKKLELKARPLLIQLENLQQEFLDAPVSGPLHLAVTPSVGMAWTAELIERFRKAFPLVELHVTVALSGAAGESIARGQFDIGIIYSPTNYSRLLTTELWEERSYLVCKSTDPLCERKSVRLSEVLRRPLLLPSAQYGIRALLDDFSDNLEVELNIAMEVDSIQLAMELVRRGTGDLILTERALPDISTRHLKALPISHPQLLRTAEMAASETALLRAPARAFWDFVSTSSDGARPYCKLRD